MDFKEELRQLEAQMAKRHSLEQRKKSLESQEWDLECKIKELEHYKNGEQRETGTFKGGSLAVFFYELIGRKEHRLNKEGEEDGLAAVKYDAAVQELTAVRKDLLDIQKKLRVIEGCRERYQNLMDQRREEMKVPGAAEREKVIALEEKLANLAGQKEEIEEALSVGRGALDLAESVAKSLKSANDWGTWDMIGGGLISTMEKQGHLDTAQGKVEQLQVQLRRFKTELEDVRIRADIQVNVDGFLRFADWFFDGLFVDWAVLDKIHHSQSQTDSVIGQIKDVLRKLEILKEDVCRQESSCRYELNSLIWNS